MSAHTPRPWRWEFNKQSKSVYMVGGKPMFDKTVMQFARWGMDRSTPMFNSLITGNQYNVMERLCDESTWTQPFPGLEHHASWRMDVIHPDARLMAAAPCLFEALKAMVEIAELTIGWMPTPKGADGPLIQARAAIAKATGGTV